MKTVVNVIGEGGVEVELLVLELMRLLELEHSFTSHDSTTASQAL
jgi:hypothetical protein